VIAYFKYTSGDDFTLNGVPYTGPVTVINSQAYTGSIFNSNSRALSSTGTFLANCILNKLDFKYTAEPAVEKDIKSVSVYPRTILTLDELTGVFDILNGNNLTLYTAGVRFDNNFLNPLYRSYDNLSFTNCITSFSNIDFRPVKLPLSKLPITFTLQATDSNFTNLFNPAYQKNTVLLTDNLSGFRYFNSEGLATGKVNSISALDYRDGYQINSTFSHNYLYYNKYANTIYQTNSNTYSIFDTDYASPVPRVILRDTISLSLLNTPLSLYAAAYGRNFRSVIVQTGSDRIIEVYGVTNSEKVLNLTRESLGLDTFTSICQRFEDDILIVYGSREDQPVIASFDIENLINNDFTPISYSETTLDIPTYMECVDFDSDVLALKTYNSNNYLEKVELVSISSPRLPLTRFNKTFSSIVRVNDIVNTMTTDLSADSTVLGTVLGTFFSNYDSYFVDMQYSTGSSINTAIVTRDSFTVDTKTAYTYLLPSNLKQNYSNTQTAIRHSSLGLTVNSILRSIIQDTLIIYYNFAERFRYSTSSGLPLDTIANTLRSFNLDNLLLFSNESINIGSLNRVINSIITIQSVIAREIDNN
jgi:hypothetical protein